MPPPPSLPPSLAVPGPKEAAAEVPKEATAETVDGGVQPRAVGDGDITAGGFGAAAGGAPRSLGSDSGGGAGGAASATPDASSPEPRPANPHVRVLIPPKGPTTDGMELRFEQPAEFAGLSVPELAARLRSTAVGDYPVRGDSNDKTNLICAALLMHPDLLKHPDAVRHCCRKDGASLSLFSIGRVRLPALADALCRRVCYRRRCCPPPPRALAPPPPPTCRPDGLLTYVPGTSDVWLFTYAQTRAGSMTGGPSRNYKGPLPPSLPGEPMLVYAYPDPNVLSVRADGSVRLGYSTAAAAASAAAAAAAAGGREPCPSP